MCGLKLDGGAKAARQAAAETRAAEDTRQVEVNDGRARIDSTFSRFDDGFYAGRERAYSDYYTPQLDEQYNDALKSLTFALADAGLLNSSVAAGRTGDLERDYARRRQEITSNAKGLANQTRGDVETARGELVQQLSATGDAQGVGNSAVSRAATLAAQPSFSPLAQVFQNTVAGIGAAQAAQGAGTTRRGTSMFSTTGAGSGRVVG
jgi:hypothetical protein